MKAIIQSSIFTLALAIFTISTNTSCKKEETPAPDTTSTATPIVVPTFSLNTWKVVRNDTYINAITSKSLSIGGGYDQRTYSYNSTTNVNGQIKTALLYITFADSLNAPQTGNYTLIGLPNTHPVGNQVYIMHAGTSASGTFYSKQNGGTIHVDNNWGSITITGNDLLGNNSAPTTSLSINLEYY